MAPSSAPDPKAAPTPAPKPTEVKEPQPTPAPAAPDYLDFETSKGKKVKVKVDGVESEVSFEELHRSYQTDRSLTQRAQRLAEERRRFEEERKGPPAQPAAKPNDPKAPANPDDPVYQELIAPHIRPLVDENKALKDQIAEMQKVLAPIQRDQHLDADEAHFNEMGFPGFKEAAKSGKIRGLAFELTKREPGEEESAYFQRVAQTWDTRDGVHKLFLTLKAREAAAAKPAAPPAPPAPPKEPAPAPKVPDVEGASGGPSGSQQSNAALSEAFKKASESKSMDDWANYFALRDKKAA